MPTKLYLVYKQRNFTPTKIYASTVYEAINILSTDQEVLGGDTSPLPEAGCPSSSPGGLHY